jgi:DNA-binding transcriptional regulator LsrR (DeoR family)
LETHFELREAIVVDTLDYHSEATVSREIGSAAAEYLLRILTPGDQVVISWGSALLGMTNALAAYRHRETIGDLTIIQGLGGLGDPNDEVHASDLVRRLAKILHAKALLLPAPGVAGNDGAAKAFHEDPHVARTLDAARNANVAFMGIGAPRSDSILVKAGNIVTWPELDALKQKGGVGDINLRYFDAAGQSLNSSLNQRVVGLTLQEIHRIGHVVGVAGGAVKYEAIQAALRGKLIDVLVTDHVTANKLMASTSAKKSLRLKVSKPNLDGKAGLVQLSQPKPVPA